MSFHLFSLKVALIGMAVILPAAPALSAYECRFSEVTGTAAPQGSRGGAERDAKRAWEAAARSQFGFNYRWALAVKTTEPTGNSRNGRWQAFAKAYPCRVRAMPTGTVMVNPTDADMACANRPNLQTAKAHNCATFYLLGR